MGSWQSCVESRAQLWTQTSPPLQMQSFLHYQHTTLAWCICYSRWIKTDTSLSPQIYNCIRVIMCYNSMVFDKYIMMWLYHCSIIQSSFIVLKITCVPPIYLLLSNPGNCWCFSCLYSLPVLKCHIFEIIQYTAFSD